jgi:hypothetical protein
MVVWRLPFLPLERLLFNSATSPYPWIQDVSLMLGYDAKDQLVWTGHRQGWSLEDYETITCPWTFYQSVTAQ